MQEIVGEWARSKNWQENQNEMTSRQLIAYKFEKIMLVVTELAECAEYLRVKDQPAMDDKVPHITGEAAELADAVIRILHYAAEFGIDLGEAIRQKHIYNTERPSRHNKLC